MTEELELKKIEFNNLGSKKTNDNIKEEKKMKRNNVSKKRKFLYIIPVIVLFLVIFSIFVGLKVKIVYADAQKTYSQAKLALDALKKQNVIEAKEELLKTDNELNSLKKDLENLSFLGYIPVLNLYYNDASHLVNAGSYGIDAGITVVDSLIPYADVLGLKGEKSFVGGSAEERIQTAVKTLGKVVPKIDEIEVNLIKAREEIDQVDPNHYPKIWKLKSVQENLATIRTLADEGITSVKDAKPLIKVLPDILGEPESKKYLIIYQNDNELRPTGGFITFYSVFRIEHGIVHVETSSDIYDLDNSVLSHPKAPKAISKYLEENSLLIRNSNFSPDFSQSMDTFMQMFNNSSKKVKVDGVIALDTDVLVHILEILGETSASGVTFKSDIDPRCNCPQVIYMLESFVDAPRNYVVENRKAIIGDLLYALMNKAFSSSPKLYWGNLFQRAMEDTQQKHILFYLFNEEAQKGIEALNWGGRIKEFEGDYLHINDSNFGGAKSNMYVKQSVLVDYKVENDGKITKSVTIDYKNSEAASNCNLERTEGLCLNAILRDYLRIYTSPGSKLIESKGSQVKIGEFEELGKTVFDGFLEVRPLGKSQVTFKYELPFKLDKGSKLPVMIQKQPGTKDIQYEISVNGKKRESFVLHQDKVLNLEVF